MITQPQINLYCSLEEVILLAIFFHPYLHLPTCTFVGYAVIV